MFFKDWDALLRVLLVCLLAYPAVIIQLRISGKRTLSKWNAFDLIVTVAMGSILSSVILLKSVALVDGLLAFGLLILLQFLITWLSMKVPLVRRLVKSQPTLLLHNGRMLPDAMKKQRVTASEVRAAVRSSGIAALEEVRAVVLETDGGFSVIPQTSDENSSALADVG